MKDIKALRIMVLADKLDSELKAFNIKSIIDPVEQSKFRNLNKSLYYFIEYIDNKLKTDDMVEEFQALCDKFELKVKNN